MHDDDEGRLKQEQFTEEEIHGEDDEDSENDDKNSGNA